MSPSRGAVLLTGTTGFIGMELLARYLERSDRDVVALVRAGSPEGARARIDAVLENLFGARWRDQAHRVTAMPADVTAPGLGLARADLESLAERVTTIVHSAASVSFTLPIEEARDINVAGTINNLGMVTGECQNGDDFTLCSTRGMKFNPFRWNASTTCSEYSIGNVRS